MDLLKGFLGIGDNIKDFLQDAIKNVGKGLGNAAQGVGNYFDPTKVKMNWDTGKQSANFWTSPVAQGLANFQQFATTPPKIDVMRYMPKPVQNNGVAKFGGAVVNDILNTPVNLLESGARIGTHVREGQFNTPQTIVGDLAHAASPLLNIVTLGAGSAVKGAAKQGLVQLLKEGAFQGGKYGLIYGTAQGLDENTHAKSFADQLLNTVPYSVGGLISGTALGGLLTAAGIGASKIGGTISKETRQLFSKELPGQIASDLRTGIAFTQNWAKPYEKAFTLDKFTDDELIGAISKFQAGDIGDELANDILRRTSGAFLPKPLADLPTPDLAHIWDYILARKNGSWVDKVPAQLEGLDRSIFKLSGTRLLQTGKIDFGAEIKNPLKKEPIAKPVAEVPQPIAKMTQKEQRLIEEFPEILQPDDVALLRSQGASQKEIDALQVRIQKAYAKQKAPNLTQPEAAPSAQLAPSGDVVETAPVVPEPPKIETPPLDVKAYVDEQAAAQKAAAGSAPGIVDNLQNIGNEIKRKVVDFTAPIEDALSKAEKEGKFRLLPGNDVRYQIDKALRSDTVASQFIRDNGFDKVIQRVDSLPEFNQYLIAKRALEVSGKAGKETGRDLIKDQQLVQSLSAKYEPFVQQVRDYNNKLLDYKVQSGLIPKDLAEALKREYPDYVPLQRVFSALEEEAMHPRTGKGGVASISTQNVLKRMQGSEREIINPIESIIENTAVAFREGERNKAAQMLTSYEKLPGNPFQLRKLDPGEATTGKHTVSAFIDGKKVVYETTPEVAQAAKNLNAQQLNILGKILSVPTRALQMGAVGLNLPFVVSNLIRDQFTAGVISDRATKTSLINPVNFVKAFYNAVGHGALYDDWVRSGSSFTQFDIARGQVAPTVEKIRADRGVGSKIAYKVTHPAELFRAVEDIIGTAEQVTRLQQFGGTRDALLKEGRTAADAEILAGAASRTNTANFGRKGEWGSVLNGAIPFFNAGIQGARSLVNAFKNNPKGTTVRFATTIGMPVVTTTLWNMADEQRRAAYNDIPEYEKANNLIILPPVPVKDENGNYNAIKIPITPGLANLMSVVRRQVEGTQSLGKTAADVFQAATSIDPTNLLSSVTPQALKPFLEDATNTNLFTKQKIVPEYMKNLPADQQVKADTSDIAKTIGGVLGVSPLRVENFVSTAFAGVGRQLIGKASIPGEFDRRFFSVRGGEGVNKIYEEINKGIAGVSGASTGNVDRDLQNYGKVLKFDQYLGDNPYTGIKAAAWEDEKIGIARKAYGGEDNYDKMPEEVKKKLYAQLGFKEEDVDYDYSANQKDDVKSDYLYQTLNKSDLTHEEAIAALVSGRKESLSGKMLVSNGVVDNLYEEGFITSAERTALKKIKLNAAGEAKAGSGGAGKGSGGLSKSEYKKLLTQLQNLNESIGKGLMSPPKLQSLIRNSKQTKATGAPSAASLKIPPLTAEIPNIDIKPVSLNSIIANSKTLAPRVRVSGSVQPAGRSASVAKSTRLTPQFYRVRRA